MTASASVGHRMRAKKTAKSHNTLMHHRAPQPRPPDAGHMQARILNSGKRKDPHLVSMPHGSMHTTTSSLRIVLRLQFCSSMLLVRRHTHPHCQPGRTLVSQVRVAN
jgi:hypothetical protein